MTPPTGLCYCVLHEPVSCAKRKRLGTGGLKGPKSDFQALETKVFVQKPLSLKCPVFAVLRELLHLQCAKAERHMWEKKRGGGKKPIEVHVMYSQTALKASHSVRIVTLPSPRSGEEWRVGTEHTITSHLPAFPQMHYHIIIFTVYSTPRRARKTRRCNGSLCQEKKNVAMTMRFRSLFFFFSSFLPFLNLCAVIYILAWEHICLGI